MLRYFTAGESHGKGLTAIIDGIPSGLSLRSDSINKELARRQRGYGRGERMKIEKDTAEIYTGVRHGKTLGSPITLFIPNKDFKNWEKAMSIEPLGSSGQYKKLTAPRPGHADLAGVLKYDFNDIRNVLERASARETAARVGIGTLCKILLAEFKINILSRTVSIGTIEDNKQWPVSPSLEEIDSSPLRCLDRQKEKSMIDLIDAASKKGDTLGGVFEVIATNVPPGLGSYTQWDLKLDALLAQGLMSIQGVKGVETGLGFSASRFPGSQVHDEIHYSRSKGFYRKTNNAGGIEGGMSNGETIVLRSSIKPISTLKNPLTTVDIVSKKPQKAIVERSDVCVVPAAGIIGEAVVSFEIARQMRLKFGADSLTEMKRNYSGYMKNIRNR